VHITFASQPREHVCNWSTKDVPDTAAKEGRFLEGTAEVMDERVLLCDHPMNGVLRIHALSLSRDFFASNEAQQTAHNVMRQALRRSGKIAVLIGTIHANGANHIVRALRNEVQLILKNGEEEERHTGLAMDVPFGTLRSQEPFTNPGRIRVNERR